MDSNFQVKITADLGDLTAKIKNIEATLAKLDSSFKKAGAVASTSFKDASKTIANVGMDMNRARLATFAFGQVIRDAGFFSQSFGLGLLAISNNIPILIDQLVMLSGISAGVGAAISLVGSFLTAALTIWAYSSMAVGKNTDELTKNKEVLDTVKISGEEYYKTLGVLNQARIMGNSSAQSELTTLKLLYSQYQNSQFSLEKRKKAYDQIQELYPSYFGNIKFEQQASKNTEDAYNRLTNSILATARARAAGDLITKNSQKQLENEQKIIDLGIEANKASTEAQKAESKARGATAGTGEANERAALSLITKANSERSRASDIQKEINSLVAEQLKLQQNNLTLERSVTDEIKNGADITDDKTKNAADSVDKLAQAYENLKGKLRGIIGDPSITFFEGAKQKADAVADTIRKLLELGEDPRSKKLEELYKDFKGLQLGAIKPVAAKMTTETQQNTFNASQELGNEEFLTRTKNKVIEIGDAVKRVKESYKGLDELSKSAIRLVGGDLTNAFLTMLNTGELSFKSLAKAIGDMIKKLIAAAVAALILVALLSAIGLADFKNFGKNFVQGFQTLGGVKFADGGIVSGPTNALIGEYAGAKNNPEVVAPLDKLKSLIGNSGGNGNMVGQLETRVSGNDLVILMNRASKNRNGYY